MDDLGDAAEELRPTKTSLRQQLKHDNKLYFLTKFPRFSELPAELRLMIWREACPRSIVLKRKPNRSLESDARALLQACIESRTECLRIKLNTLQYEIPYVGFTNPFQGEFNFTLEKIQEFQHFEFIVKPRAWIIPGELHIDCRELCYHTEKIGKTFPRRALSITVLIDMKDMIEWQNDGSYKLQRYATAEEKAGIERQIKRTMYWQDYTPAKGWWGNRGRDWFLRLLIQRYMWIIRSIMMFLRDGVSQHLEDS